MTRLVVTTLAVATLALALAAPAVAGKAKFKRSKPHVNVGSADQVKQPAGPATAGTRTAVPPWRLLPPGGFEPRFDLPGDLPRN